MARKMLTHWLHARIEETAFNELQEYVKNADTTAGELIREAVKEYMWAHPVSKKSTTKLLKDSK